MALIAIVALLGGVPYALWTWGGGAPWPESAPSGDWLTESLGAEQMLGVLVAILWLAWAHFAVCVVVEFVQGRRSSARVPGGGVGTQSLARRLVASAMLLVGSAAVAMPTATAATSNPGVEHSAVAGLRGSGGDVGHASDQSVKPAQTTVKQVKQKVSKHAELRPGLAIRTPQGVQYEVQPPHQRQYDCLWDIAERYLGDGLRWKEIYHLNKDLEQPDGNSLQDPDLIYPGWVLQLPDDAKGPGIITLSDNDDAKQMEHRSERQDRNKSGQESDDEKDHVLIRGDQEQQQASGGGDGGSEDGIGDWAAPLGVGGGLVAASVLLALRRRRGWQGGGPGGGGGLKPGDEANLRLAADGPAALLVDRSMRQLAHATYQGGHSVPPVRAAYLNEQSVTLAFDTPAMMTIPDGWRSSPDGRMWMVDRAVAETFDPPYGTASPCPSLATVGRASDGTLVMANLAGARGIVSLAGVGPTAYEVALSMAVELSSAPWTDRLPVSVVGFSENLSDLAPDRVRHATDVETVLASQTYGGMLFVAQPLGAELEQRVAAAIAQGQLAGAVLVGTAQHAAWRLEVHEDGRLVSSHLGLDVAGQRIPTAAAARMIELFRWADAGRAATPARVAPQPVPGFDPQLLERGAKAPVTVQLLGPVEVDAPGEIEPDRVALATEIVTYLALHPTGVHPSVLASAIWPRGATDEVVSAAISRVQSWLGRSADGRERLFQDDEQRWRLDLREVRVDWHALQAYVARAERAEDPTLDLASALSCVEGPALDELPAHRYAWLANTTALRDIQTTVVNVALRVSSVADDAGNLGLAHESLRTGLDMVPGCEELWRAELRLTHKHDGPERLQAVADEMFAAIARHGSPRGAEPQTTALVEELLPGYGRVAAKSIA